MNILANLNLSALSNDLVRRMGDVLVVATEHGDHDIIDWAARAASDARLLGRLRDRDLSTLERLEKVYSSGYYRTGTNARAASARVGSGLQTA